MKPEDFRGIGKINEGGIFSRLPPNTRLALPYLFNEASSWLPRLKPNDLWRPLMIAVLASQMAACQPTRGSEDLNQATPTPIVEQYNPSLKSDLNPTAILTLPPTEIPTLQPTSELTPIAISGSFEDQHTIPYPSDELVQQLGITDYQVVDNHPVALRTIIDQKTGETHQYIVAQATTNEEGGFTGWQQTVPFDVETNLIVPHPQETNPELLDLKPNSPIPQFVNSMERAGIEVTAEEVAENITFKYHQYPILDHQGNIILKMKSPPYTNDCYCISADEQGKPMMKEYVFAVWNLPEELLPKKFRDVAGPIPLMRAERDQNGEWRWYSNEVAGVVPLRTFADAINLRISVLGSDVYFSNSKYFKIFNTIYNSFFDWRMVESERGVFSPEQNYLNLVNQAAKDHHINHITGGHLIYSLTYPEWLKKANLTPEEAEQIVREHINSIMEKYPNVEIWTVLNEYRAPWIKEDSLDRALGNRLPMIVFDEARKADRDAILILNNSQNQFLSSRSGLKSLIYSDLQLAKKLKDQGLVDVIGIQMHLNQNQWQPIPSAEEFSRVLKLCRQAGLKVYITEMDVGLHEAEKRYNFPPDQRLIFQAKIYKNIINTYLKANIGNYINFWGLRDITSWLETSLGQSDADSLLFDDLGRPKLSYYAILSLLYDLANQGTILTP